MTEKKPKEEKDWKKVYLNPFLSYARHIQSGFTSKYDMDAVEEIISRYSQMIDSWESAKNEMQVGGWAKLTFAITDSFTAGVVLGTLAQRIDSNEIIEKLAGKIKDLEEEKKEFEKRMQITPDNLSYIR